MKVRLPFLKILIPFIIGIFIAIYFQFTWYWFLPIILLAFLGVTIAECRANKKLIATPKMGAVLIIIFFLLGFLRVDTFRDINRPNHFSKLNAQFYKLKVLDFPEAKYNKVRFRAQVKAASFESNVLLCTGNTLVYWDTSLSQLPELGSEYWVNSSMISIPAPKNPNEFNYKEYLSYYNIYFKTYVGKEGQFKFFSKNSFGLNFIVKGLRNNTLSIFKKYIKDKSSFLMAQALVLGGKNNLDEETKSNFAHTGTLHVLAVSGLHVGIIFLILGFITKGLVRLKKGKYLRVVLMLIGIWIYALITGFSPSVQRASIMFTLITIGNLYSARSTGLNSLFASAFIMLSLNPFLIVNVGFQLSYAAVLGIMLIYQPIYNLFSFTFIKNKTLWTIVNKAWAVCAISFAAQLATFPISVFYFGQFPIYFLFSNLVVIPIIFGLVCLAVSLVIFNLIPPIAALIAFIFTGLSKFVLFSVSWVANLPFAFASGLHLEFWQVLWLYLIIAFFIAFLHFKKLQYINISLVGIVVLLIFINVNYIRQAQEQKVVIHSIKNSNVITSINGNTATIIADSGFVKNTSAQKFFLAPYFRNNYIKHVRFKSLKGKLASVRYNEDTVMVDVYTSKYPRLAKLDNKQGNKTWLLHRNSFTDTLVCKLPEHKVIWNGISRYGSFSPSKFKTLDSFAVKL